MKKILMLFGLVIALGAVKASAYSAQFLGAGKKANSRSVDANGNPLQINDDKPWKVFEVTDMSVPRLLTDEAGVAPKQGIIKRICVESAVGLSGVSDVAVVWDTAVAAGMTATATGRRLLPPIQRVTGVLSCVEINAQFTAGCGVIQSNSGNTQTGSTFIYWRELGGFR